MTNFVIDSLIAGLGIGTFVVILLQSPHEDIHHTIKLLLMLLNRKFLQIVFHKCSFIEAESR